MSRGKRILHVVDWYYPSLGYQEPFLARIEKEDGHDVYVLTSNLVEETTYSANKDIFEKKKMVAGQFIEKGVKTIRLPAIRLPMVNAIYLIGLEMVIVKLNPDIIICHGVSTLSSIRVARLKRHLINIKIIFDDHMTFHNTRGGIYNLIYFLFKKFAMPIILDSSDQMVAITNETKEFMEHVYGIPGNKVEIIPLGVDTRLFRNDSIARKQIRLKYNIKSSEIVFIFVGKIIPAKGVHILVEAALKVMNDYQNVKVMFVGGSVKNYENFLRKIIDSSEFKDNFIFVSAVPNEELYKYYSVADIGVWPLQCSITMNEAMSCGLPIIISDESGVPEIMGKGNGLTYENGNIKDLANKMKTLMDTKLREAMASRARDFANIHDWKHIADRFLAVIGE